jgi:hypothetical protein
LRGLHHCGDRTAADDSVAARLCVAESTAPFATSHIRRTGGALLFLSSILRCDDWCLGGRSVFFAVIPAQAGIQLFHLALSGGSPHWSWSSRNQLFLFDGGAVHPTKGKELDSGFRRNDELFRFLFLFPIPSSLLLYR